jgi:hypothetical protein
MKKTTVFIIVLAGLILVVMTIVALLPGILSSDFMKPLVLQKINQQLPGQLAVQKWSMGWFSGVKGNEIMYDNRPDDMLIRIAEFETSRGLLNLMLNRGKLGTVKITDPGLIFYITDKPKAQETEAPLPLPDIEPGKREKVAIPAFYGQFVITGGSLRTVRNDGSEKVVAENVDLSLDASGPENPITYRFLVDSGDKMGHASGEGSLTLSPDDTMNVQQIRSDSKLEIKNWELEELFAILDSRQEMLFAKGRLNADVNLTGSVANSLQLSGRLSIDKLNLQGGPLAPDTPTIHGIEVELDATGGLAEFQLKNLTFRSSLATGTANGEFDDQGHIRLSSDADINLAEVFTQLPGTLRLRKGTRISSGKMTLSANVEKHPEITSFQGNARIDRLQGIRNGKKLSWDKPVTIKALGEMHPEGMRLQNLSLRSAFLNADGKGDMRNMQVDVLADIEEALKELKKFIQIREWDGRGQLKMNLHVQETSQNLNKAALKLDVKNFVLNRNRSRILAKQNIQANLAADIQMAEKLENAKFLQPSLNLQSSLASGSITAVSLAGNPASDFPNAAGLKLDGNINLQQLSSLLENLDLLSSDIRMGGRCAIKANGSLKDGQLVLSEAGAGIKKFLFRQDKKTIKENRLMLATKGHIDLNERSLQLAPLDIDSQAGKIHIPELAIADWTNTQKDMKTSAKANLDLEKVTQGYGDFIQLPTKTKLSGKGQFNIEVDFSNPKTQYFKLQGQVAPFELQSETLPTISEKRVTFNAKATRSPDGQHVTFKQFQFDSKALSLTADGSLDQVGKNKIFKAKGTMAPDLKLFSDYLKNTGKRPIEFAGKKATPFTIELASDGDRWEDPLKRLNFSGAVHIDSIKAFGLKLTPNDVPIRMSNAAAAAKLDSPANGGQLSLQPNINMKKEPYVLSFSKDLSILKEVQITKGVTEELLALIHPIFMEAVKPEGMLDLQMKYFNWPLAQEAANQASFAGSLRLNGVKLKSTPFLSNLLSLMRVKEREFDLGDQTINFEARDGRLECSPLTINIDGSPLEMYGSLGFDKTLDYVANIPLTENMVGKDAYRFLQGVSVKVPIRGTVSDPKIDETVLQEATASIIQQAMQKNLQQGVQNLLQNFLKKSP